MKRTVLKVVCYLAVFLSIVEGAYVFSLLRWNIADYITGAFVIIAASVACITLGYLEENENTH